MTILKFSSNKFGAISSTELSNNPEQGYALAEMLRNEFRTLNYQTDESVSEISWGWCFYMRYYRQQYMIGTLAYADPSSEKTGSKSTSDAVKYLVQFDKTRSLKERLFKQNQFTSDEPIIDLTAAILKFKITDMTDFLRETDP